LFLVTNFGNRDRDLSDGDSRAKSNEGFGLKHRGSFLKIVSPGARQRWGLLMRFPAETSPRIARQALGSRPSEDRMKKIGSRTFFKYAGQRS
jgi:hypothetical protein